MRSWALAFTLSGAIWGAALIAVAIVLVPQPSPPPTATPDLPATVAVSVATRAAALRMATVEAVTTEWAEHSATQDAEWGQDD